ncbi:molybdenum cofactor biosynthesis protein B [Sporosarcina sp. HYO08]|uniref:MogA/MoaB family molybdenum cofactor biosynthesis protein n=1 Tax=Sporosarcina sp. HYO08 TaxID=1759557 RepID=UPI00079239EB|nr:MogA/MoaB family molybdenum cofactor biosynthesis protein [Sporosarcina sp. HYO08]KXH83858.1 molybdenum cofactor biosynthesis protein B [Sporosarcina sp. HYO08]
MSHLSEKDRQKSLAVCVLTISDTRTEATDKSGDVVRKMLETAGHQVVDSRICRDDKKEIKNVLDQWLDEPDVQAIITTGGTGIGFRDVTIETVTPYFTKSLEGFGELFRLLSYTEDVGSKALLSRATAGAIREKILFALPGSSKAVELAMEKLIVPELHHIVRELTKHLND